MKTATTALAALVALGSFSIACSSSTTKGEDIDTGTALSGLRSPTGSFSKANGASVFAGYRSQRNDSSKVSAPMPGGGSSSPSSIRLLDRAASSSACQQGEDCACPTGGSMSYSGGNSDEGVVVRVKFNACGFEDGLKFDGDAVLLASKKSLLGITEEAPAAKPAKQGASGESGESGDLKEAPSGAGSSTSEYAAVLLAAKGTASDGNQKIQLSFALLTEAHYAFLAVSVADGNIVIGVSDSGQAIIRSKEGTWKCNSKGRSWTCTSEAGEALELEEDVASTEG